MNNKLKIALYALISLIISFAIVKAVAAFPWDLENQIYTLVFVLIFIVLLCTFIAVHIIQETIRNETYQNRLITLHQVEKLAEQIDASRKE